MFKIKKIDQYIIRTFLSYFIMTLFICIIILLMLSVFRRMDDLIGKGIGFGVLLEFFMYAIIETIPQALPLAILLASLMTFGSFGEHFELTAMKAAGVSLFRVMAGLMVFVIMISVGAFFFSNNVLPASQIKLWTLIISLREKSPEFDIPEGEFYKGIGGYSLYVQKKNQKRKLLENIKIYDFTKGFENANVTVADSGKVEFTADNKYLQLTLYNGEGFENLNTSSNRRQRENIPYRRETFKTKKVLISFDTEFNRFDEEILKDEYISKDFMKLGESIDSLKNLEIVRARKQAKKLINQQPLSNSYLDLDLNNSNKKKKILERKEGVCYHPDSLFFALTPEQMRDAVINAKREAQSMKDRVDYNKSMLEEPAYNKRRHQAEWHRKFTLSIACLIFFFIGAPLGAIVKKGGLGFPIVISVILFIIYYILDTTGYKMAREGFWEAYKGMWLSSFVLFPLGMFLTWKAVTDASLFRSEAYVLLFEKIKNKVNNRIKRYKR